MNKMTDANLINATWSVWDGSIKSFTKLCDRCRFHREVASRDRCYWGVAYKTLDRSSVLSYCQLTERTSPRERMLESHQEFKLQVQSIQR